MTDIKAYENLTARQQLTLFRNLYYNDGNATEKGIIANAINAILPEYHRQKAEIERLTKLNDILLEAGQRWQKCYETIVKEFTEGEQE